jgi:Zn-finger nucleic acid-binding protein
MTALLLPSHRGGHVDVDHCAGCRLVWFDRFESVALDGLGWVRLLRTLELGVPRPLLAAAVERPTCPHCRAPLREVQNQTRYGLFAVQECPKGHGHLQSHSGLLAERGLVRPMGWVERQALAQEKHAIHCLNCGGPAQADDAHCSYCGTALLVLDLPRLAHSLRLRHEAEGPSPRSMGQRLAWSCHGCGAALDPARDTHCGQCGHLVVAQGLPDIEPMLASAEAEWTAHQTQEAQRVARFPSQQSPRTGPVPPVLRHGLAQQRRTGLTWFLIAVWGLVAAAVLGVALSDGPWPRRSMVTDFADQRVSSQPGEAWGWLWVHERAWPTERHDRDALRRVLFRLHMRLEAGATLPPDTQLQALIDERRWASGGASGDAESLWQRQLALDLAPMVFEPPEAPTPPEPDWREVAAGLWVSPSRHSAVWHLNVRHTGHWPRWIGPLELRVPVQRPDSIAWRCNPLNLPADGPRRVTLAPGAVQALACKSLVAPTHLDHRWDEFLRALRQAEVKGWVWIDESLRQPGGMEAASQLLATHFAGQSQAVTAFLTRHELPLPPPSQGVPRRAQPGDAPAAQAPRLTPGQRWLLLPRPHRPLFVLGLLMAAGAWFSAVSLAWGTRWGLRAWMAAAVPLCWVLGGGEGAASVLWVGAGLSLCYLLGLVMSFGFRVFRAATT